MSAFKFAPTLIAAGMVSMPVLAQEAAPKTEPQTDAIFVLSGRELAHGCAFTQTDPDSSATSAIVFTKPVVISGVEFGKGDVIFEFKGGAEFLVANGKPRTLEGTKPVAMDIYGDEVNALIPHVPDLVDVCVKAREEWARQRAPKLTV